MRANIRMHMVHACFLFLKKILDFGEKWPGRATGNKEFFWLGLISIFITRVLFLYFSQKAVPPPPPPAPCQMAVNHTVPHSGPSRPFS